MQLSSIVHCYFGGAPVKNDSFVLFRHPLEMHNLHRHLGISGLSQSPPIQFYPDVDAPQEASRFCEGCVDISKAQAISALKAENHKPLLSISVSPLAGKQVKTLI